MKDKKLEIDKMEVFINPNDNDKFSKMCRVDIDYLLYNIDRYYLKLRNKLGFEDYITFGLELEFEQATDTRLKSKVNEKFYSTWNLDEQESRCYKLSEIKSPILKDSGTTWSELEEVCSIVSEYTKINDYSGGHIHVGTQVLGNDVKSWLKFIKLWSVYENIIYRFTYGSHLTARKCISRYAKPMNRYFWKCYVQLEQIDNLDLDKIINKITLDRHQAVNFLNVKAFNSEEVKNTIEFRCPNATLNPTIWQNNVNLFVNILKYSKSESYDNNIINMRKIKNSNQFKRLPSYGHVYLEQALELCDLIFQNNFDKVYFLRQYIKSFELCKKSEYKQGKPFTKSLNN